MKLPWPSPYLNPNSNASWHKKYKAKKKLRADCFALAKADGKRKFPDGPIKLKVSFYPPDFRKRDADNMMASCKALFDGIADAWGVDDNRFRFEFEVYEVEKFGAVKVEVLS